MGDEIKGLEYSNGKENDIFSKFTVSVFDATSYESEAQPRLRMKCLVNNAATVHDINFMYMDPADLSFRKYNVEVDAFKDMKFIFDTDKMRI